MLFWDDFFSVFSTLIFIVFVQLGCIVWQKSSKIPYGSTAYEHRHERKFEKNWINLRVFFYFLTKLQSSRLNRKGVHLVYRSSLQKKEESREEKRKEGSDNKADVTGILWQSVLIIKIKNISYLYKMQYLQMESEVT